MRPEPAEVGRLLCRWFARNGRDLPWRRDYAPYAVLVSEIMLQQTQMDRVTAYFERWMERFPSLQALADAPEEAVLKAWEGLGYYSRARNLHRAAGLILHGHGGNIPADPQTLRRLPGIGPYTAGAVASIAHNRPEPAVDANAERVLARLWDVDLPVKSLQGQARFRELAGGLMAGGEPRVTTQAVMELGALVCGKRPDCNRCPLEGLCLARQYGITAERPLPGKKTEYLPLEIVTGVLLHEGRIFIQKRPENGVWGGLWEFPGGRLEAGETPEQGVTREFLEETELHLQVREKLGIIRHAYTRYRIIMHCFLCSLNPEPSRPAALHAATENAWLTLPELEVPAMPAGHRKLLHAFGPRIAKALEEA